MRTLQEKYNAVLEGGFSKTQFRRDAAMELPQFVSSVNSFDDTVAILKNKGIVTEAKKNERYFESDPADHISPDVLDTGIKCELEKKFNTTDVTPEQYEKAKEAAVKNLTKDRAYYAKESGEQLDTPAEQMEKASLKEGKAEAWAEYQKKHNVTDKTVKVAKKDFEKEWEAGNLKEETDVLFARKLKAAGHDYDKMRYDLGDAVADGKGLEGASAEELKIYAQIATRLGDDLDVTNAFEYLESLPNYNPEFTPERLRKVAEVNETVDTDELRARIANILKGQLKSLNKMGGDAIIEDYIETQIKAYLDGDVDIEEPMEVVNDFREYMDYNQSAAHAFNADLEPKDPTPESPKKDNDEETLEENDEESPEDYANANAGSPMHAPPGLEEEDLSEPDVEDLYQHDQEYLDTLKKRKALKEMFKKIIVNLINE